MVRTRFAPSPTGQLHIGGLRTALMNYLFAKKHGGEFILRIEDTDRTRYHPDAEEKIHSVLDTFRLFPDEHYKQSLRLKNYGAAVEELLERGKAYKCFCTEERLELLRKDAAKRNQVPKYDRRCSHLTPDNVQAMIRDGKPSVVRFRMDRQDVGFKDEVFGQIQQNIDESDPVLLKSDGFPTYHLANVVDDHEMAISHVVRGMEWLSSTGKHHLLYKAFEWSPPKFVHLSLIMRTATKKLSKRDQDSFVDFYTNRTLPVAVLNLLIRNGSGIKDFDPERLYSLEEMVENFDVESLTRRNLLLDSHVLSKYSRMAILNADFEKIILPECRKLFEIGFPGTRQPSEEYLRKVINFVKEKEESFDSLNLLFDGKFRWFFEKPTSSEEILKAFPDKNNLGEVLEALEKIDFLSPEAIKKTSEALKISSKKIFHVARIAWIGRKEGPPITEIIDFFGQEELKRRFTEARSLLG